MAKENSLAILASFDWYDVVLRLDISVPVLEQHKRTSEIELTVR